MSGLKIATCHYCGTRAALVLRGRERQELSCSSCGAPLHDMKMLPKQPDDSRKPRVRHAAHPADSHSRAMSRADHGERRKPRRTKSLARRLFGEIVDIIEDIVD
jgi:hypothetical protein